MSRITTSLVDLSGMDRAEIEQTIADLGEPRYRGRQIFHWIWARGVTDFSLMTDLRQPLRTKLAESCRIDTPVLEAKHVSTDGTTKYLFQLADGRRIESVFIPDTPAQTFCVS